MRPTSSTPLGTAGRVALALVLAALSVVRTIGGEERERYYNVPVGDAAVTLRKFAEVSGREILFAAEAVRGVQTNAVRGEFTALEALQRLLAGTGLHPVPDEFSTAFAVRKPPEPRPARKTPEERPMKQRTLLSQISLWFSLALAAAQQAATAQEDLGDGEVVTMSPFTVSSEGDVGYLAQSSLSGSRLNTNLGDLAVPTTAFTPEFIQDVASTSVDELAKFMLSTETRFPEANQAFFTADSAPLRIRGLPATTYSINYFPTIQRLDHFNTERVDQSRGPNSILFGLGSPGGLINISTKRADPRRNFGSLTLQARSWDGWRTMVDYNYTLIDDRLALRLAAVKDDRETWRHHEYDDQERVYLTGQWRLLPSTTLDVEWESGNVDKSVVAPWVVADAYTPWVEAGRNLSDTPNVALGIRNRGGAQQIVIDTATGEARNWRLKTASVFNRLEGVQVYLSDFDLVPKEATMHAGRAFPQLTDSSRLAAFLSHSFSPDFSMELAATRHVMDRLTFNGASFATLNVDTNVTLPNGTPNPNAGRPYLENFPVRNTLADEVESLRVTAAYSLDLGRGGHHQIAALGERDWTRQANLQERLYNVQTPFNLNSPENGNNLIRFRTYVDLDGPASEISVGDWSAIPLSSLVDADSGREVGADWINFVGGSHDNRFELDSAMGVLQSRFFEDRLITVVGYRKDWRTAWYSPNGRRGEPTGNYNLGEFIVVPYGQPAIETEANNLTGSALFRLTPWLGLTYNRASNSALPAQTAALPTEGGRAPSPRGRSEDIGFKIDLGQRLSLSAVYFETSAERDFQAAGARPGNMFNTIWTAFDAAGHSAPGGGSALDELIVVNGFTFDTASSGIEIELIANPTDNWRIFANYSDTEVERTNLGREEQAYLAAHRDFWLEGDRGRILLDGSGELAPVADNGDNVVETVAEGIAEVEERFINEYIIPDGERPRGQIPRKFNLRTNYSFAQGALRGWSVGGGARYHSGQVTSFRVETEPSGGTTKSVVYGDATALFDLHVRYEDRFQLAGRDLRWSLQLNVNNLLDEDDILPVRVASDGTLLNYRLQQPREFILTARISF